MGRSTWITADCIENGEKYMDPHSSVSRVEKSTWILVDSIKDGVWVNVYRRGLGAEGGGGGAKYMDH